jgi:hypothetical protein
MTNRTAIDPALRGSLVCPTDGKPCKGFTYRGQGRISPQLAKLRIEPANGLAVHEVKAQDGWYAVIWKAKGSSTEWGGKLTAYDAAGKVLKTLPIIDQSVGSRRVSQLFRSFSSWSASDGVSVSRSLRSLAM